MRLSACLDDHEGGDDWSRYEALGLPGGWIDSCRAAEYSRIAPDEYPLVNDTYFEDYGASADVIAAIRAATGSCFWDLSLQQQCAALEVIYLDVQPEQIDPGYRDRGTGRGVGEQLALEALQAEGWHGTADGGRVFHLALYVVERRLSRTARYLPAAQRRMNSATTADLKAIILSLSAERLVTDLRIIKPPGRYLELDIASVERGWSLIDLSQLEQLCVFNFLGYTNNGAGWPDVTVRQGRDMKHVEVKRLRDSLNFNQVMWVRNIARPMGWQSEVWRLAMA